MRSKHLKANMKIEKNVCLLVLLTVLFVVATCHSAVSPSLRWTQKAIASCTQPSFQRCVSCDLDPKEVTLHVLNTLKEPHLDQSLTLKCTVQKYLLGMMEEAADKDKSFRFSATYFNLALGWYVDAYNGVYADYSKDKSYWEILDGDMKPTPLGVSSYKPKNGETVTFNLTIYS